MGQRVRVLDYDRRDQLRPVALVLQILHVGHGVTSGACGLANWRVPRITTWERPRGVESLPREDLIYLYGFIALTSMRCPMGMVSAIMKS